LSRRPASACIRESCQNCEIYGRVICVHTKRDLLDFFVLVINLLVPFILGMVVGGHWYGLFVWFILAAIFFGYVEAYIMCRHCPQYAEEGKTLRCHANWELPKIPASDPNPMNKLEKVTWLIYAAVLSLYWLPFFLLSGQRIYLVWASVSALVSIYQLIYTKCNRCYMLSCPLNNVPEDVRGKIEEYYPDYS